jgi:hypothetical protein
MPYENSRIFWAILCPGIGKPGATPTVVHGAQSLGVTTNFNITPIFELGQSSPYENVEDIPNVEISMEKVLDGYPLIYHLATRGYATPTLIGRSAQRCSIFMPIYGEVQDSASGTAIVEMQCSGMFISSTGFTMPVEGPCTETASFVGNNKLWKSSGFTMTGTHFDNSDVPLAYTSGLGGVQHRQNVVFSPTTTTSVDANSQVADTACTILPPDVAGISSSGTNRLKTDGNYACSVQSISVSADLNRDSLYELGHKGAYFRPVGFPVAVTCDIEINAKSGDMVDCYENGVGTTGRNLTNRTIKVKMTEGTFIDLGTKNKLSNITYGGANAGNGIGTITYSFTTQNDYTVTHPMDPVT